MQNPNSGIRQLKHILLCNYTGVPIGCLDLSVTAGHMPYLSHWEDMVCYHPLFSLHPTKLILFMEREWTRLAQSIVDDQVSERESTLLRVGFVALLHSLGSIKQDRGAIGIPPLYIVQSNLESLLALCSWKNFLESKRFKFPELHISNFNANTDFQHVKDYLDACWEQKKAWEQGLDDRKEQERARIAEQAILSIKNNFFKPTNKKLLWQWLNGHIVGTQWQSDAWIRSIFLSSDSSIPQWDWDEIELFDEIVQSIMPLGAETICHSVREHIANIKRKWKNHYDAFVIEEDGLEYIEELRTELAAEPEPQPSSYSSRGAYLQARARWELAHSTPYQADPARTNNAASRLENL